MTLTSLWGHDLDPDLLMMSWPWPSNDVTVCTGMWTMKMSWWPWPPYDVIGTSSSSHWNANYVPMTLTSVCHPQVHTGVRLSPSEVGCQMTSRSVVQAHIWSARRASAQAMVGPLRRSTAFAVLWLFWPKEALVNIAQQRQHDVNSRCPVDNMRTMVPRRLLLQACMRCCKHRFYVKKDLILVILDPKRSFYLIPLLRNKLLPVCRNFSILC